MLYNNSSIAPKINDLKKLNQLYTENGKEENSLIEISIHKTYFFSFCLNKKLLIHFPFEVMSNIQFLRDTFLYL